MRTFQSKVELGTWGEAAAQHWLGKQNYTLVTKNYRTRFGEIDLIMRQGDSVVFVEVKTRQSDDVARALWAVHPQKQRRMLMAAQDFVAKKNLAGCVLRFEIVLVMVLGERVRFKQIVMD